MLDLAAGKLSDVDHERTFQDIEKSALRKIAPHRAGEQLTAVFLAGQPGAGKSALKTATERELPADRTIKIDVDELRERHQGYRKWQADPATEKHAADLTHEDASAWGKKLLRTAIANKCNVIVDGTLGNPESAQRQIETLIAAGYNVIVKSLAVQREVSELGVHERFETGKALKRPRWVPSEIQDKAYHGLPKTLDAIEKNNARYNAQVQVYGRNGDKLYDNLDRRHDGPQSAREALEKERNRPLSPEERQTYSRQWDKVLESMARRNAPAHETEEVVRKANAMRPVAAQESGVASVAGSRDPRAESFARDSREVALGKYPELAGAYAALTAIDKRALADGLTPQQRAVVGERTRQNIISSIEQGKVPEVKIREHVEGKRERNAGREQAR